MEDMTICWIDKHDVVKRQIKEAIRLYFEQRDSVVIHTIVASAHQILFDLGSRKEIPSFVKNTKALKEEEIQSFLRSINYPFNFFKHAKKDPDTKINLGPLERFTQDFIMDAILIMQQLSGDIPIEAKVYWYWFVAKYHEEFDDRPSDSELSKMQAQGLGDWDFPTICQFLTFCDVAGKGKSLPVSDTVKADDGREKT